MLRTVVAPNASALTLEGTRTYLVGKARVVVIDPGSTDPGHLDAVADAIGDGVLASVAVTHAHPDHISGADELAARFGCPVRARKRGSLQDGDRLETDAGEIRAIATPGHAPDHMALHWPEQRAVFCGDLMMGGHDTALVAPPEGRLGPYLASLRRIRALEPAVIHPAHGPAFRNADQAIDRYLRHRELRLEQVERAVAVGRGAPDALLRAVYGPGLEPELRAAAAAALKAYLEHLQGQGRIRRSGQDWEVVSA